MDNTLKDLSIKSKIASLNNPQTGSLGEYLFMQTLQTRGIQVYAMHRNRIDFIIGNLDVDVKTSRKINRNDDDREHIYYGKKVPGVHYAHVEFFSNDVRISFPELDILIKYQWNIVERYFNEWNMNRPRLTTRHPQNTQVINILGDIKHKIQELFKKRGYSCRIIYRTNQKDFGKESPGNLIPREMKKNNFTVFISFNYIISVQAIDEIFVFRDENSNSLPTIQKTRFHLKKVDLEQTGKKNRFKSITDLENRLNSVLFD